jgi:large subunit ribosomal protein L9
MKVVFFEDVEGTALVGDVKEVKNGFARNFLLPRGLAGPTTPTNLQHANALAKKEARRQERLDTDAQSLVDRLSGYTITIEARVGETGRLFGSVTNRDIAELLSAKANMQIDPHIVLLPEPIRDLGPRPVPIKFTRNVSVDVTVEVVPDEESRPLVERLEAERAAKEAEEAKRAAEAAYAAGQRAEASREAAEQAAEEAMAAASGEPQEDGEAAADDESN